MQHGKLYERSGKFYVRYRATEIVDGVQNRVQKSHLLASKDDQFYSLKSRALKDVCATFMDGINSQERNLRLENVTPEAHPAIYVSKQVLKDKTKGLPPRDLTISDFWTEKYYPFIKKNKKKSTQSEYKHIWNRFLKDHFGDTLLRSYSTSDGTTFITEQCEKGYAGWSLANVRTVASAIFAHAIATDAAGKGVIKRNPWRGVKNLGRVKRHANTKHYTLENINQMIQAFDHCTVLHQQTRKKGCVSTPHAAPEHAHTDACVLLALCFYLGLRPHEAVALEWTDYVDGKMRINKGYVRGVLDTNKTDDDTWLPVIEQLAALLKRHRKEQGAPKTGYILANQSKRNPLNIGNFYRRVVRPCLEEHGLEWSGMYAGRRGAGTMLVDLTGGLVAAQELLRHKSMTTTADFYKKLTQNSLTEGMKLLEQAASK